MKTIRLRTFATIMVCLACASTTLAADSTVELTDGEAPSSERSEASSDLVSLQLWIVTLSGVEDEGNHEQIGPLLARVGNLPTVVGRRDHVRMLIGRLEERNAIGRLQDFRLTTLSGHEASAIAAERKPRITAAATTQFGQTNTLVYEQFGTAVHLTPHASRGGRIRVDVKLEASDLEDRRDVAMAVSVKGEAVFAPTVTSSQVATIASVPNGEAVLIARTFDTAKHVMQLVILSAEVVEPARVAEDKN